MKRKILWGLLAFSLLFPNLSSTIKAEEAKGKIIDIGEASQSQTTISHTYEIQSIEEQIKTATSFFEGQVSKYMTMQSTVALSLDTTNLDVLRRSIQEEDRLSAQMYKQMNGTISLIKSLDKTTQDSYKSLVYGMLTKMKESRIQARKTLQKLDKRMNSIQETRSIGLTHVAELAKKMNQLQKALDAYSKLASKNKDDMKLLYNIQDIVENKKESYFFFDHELISLQTPMIIRNGKTYLPVEALSKMKGVEYSENANTSSQMITYEDDILVVTQQAVLLNGKFVGNPFLFLRTDGHLYVDIKILIELLGFAIQDVDGLDMIYVSIPTFTYNEMDRLTVNEIMHMVFK